MKKLLLLSLLLFFGNDLSATHLMGGEITWECAKTGVNAGKLKFTMILYRECRNGTGNAAGLPANTNLLGGLGSISVVRTTINNVSPTCYDGQLSCATGGAAEGRMEEHVYKSSWITANGTPPPAGWEIYWTSCCRPGSISNGGSNAGYWLRAKMFPYTPPGSGAPLTMNTCYDSSPQFAEKPKSIICTGYPYTFSHNAYEPEFDSVHYSFADPLGSSAGVVAYSSPYSVTSPFPNQGNPNGFTPSTGLITINPAAGGSFMSCIKVESYRCNQKISEIFRDVAMVIKTGCELTGTSSPNVPPVLTLDSIPGLTGVVIVPTKQYSGYGTDTVWQATVNPGDLVNFRLTATDNQLTPLFNLQNVSFSAKSAQIHNSTISGSCAEPPCAFVTPVSPATSFTNPLSLNIDFSWQIACNHISSQGSCGTGANSYYFPLKMQDDACPANGVSVATLRIDVVPSVPSAPDLSNSCLSFDASNNSVVVNWDTPADTGTDFQGYIVFHGTAAGIPFTAVDTIFGAYLPTTYNHLSTNPIVAPVANGNNLYYLRCIGSCGYESVNSDTLQMMILDVTPIPPTNSSVAQLDWTPNVSGSSAMYEIWRRPLGAPTSSWTVIDSTNSLTFNDTVNTCGQDLEYQIRIAGLCNSTTDSGSFSDSYNTDILVIDSVSVVAGTAIISWSGNTNGDVVDFDLLEYDPATGWNSIATVPYGTAMPFTIPGALPLDSVKTYKVISTDSCGNQSSDLLVSRHNNILLTESLDPCEGILRLKWNTYRGWPGGVGAYRVLADVTPPGGPTQVGVLFATKTATDSAFNTKAIIGGWNYCFYIQAVDTGITHFSTSNEICMNSLAVQRSRILYMAKASVRPDNAVELVCYVDKDADIIHFDLQRAETPGAAYTSLGMIPKPVIQPSEIRFTDFSADPQNHLYEYRFVATDSCGGIDTASNVGVNMLLDVESKENLTNVLSWNSYRQFMGGVRDYEIYRSIGVSANGFVKIGATSDTFYVDNIRDDGDNVGIFCYRIVATEQNNPLGFVDFNGLAFNSTSNEACAEHEPRVFIPNSFNPNSENIENNIWKPVHLYVEESSYSLEIYDRWGNKVFGTNDETKGWDGKVSGEYAPVGAYIYQLKYRSKQGEPVEKRGSITLMY
jgi:gliding motility-associated-like protein